MVGENDLGTDLSEERAKGYFKWTKQCEQMQGVSRGQRTKTGRNGWGREFRIGTVLTIMLRSLKSNGQGKSSSVFTFSS